MRVCLRVCVCVCMYVCVYACVCVRALMPPIMVMFSPGRMVAPWASTITSFDKFLSKHNHISNFNPIIPPTTILLSISYTKPPDPLHSPPIAVVVTWIGSEAVLSIDRFIEHLTAIPMPAQARSVCVEIECDNDAHTLPGERGKGGRREREE